ncbi:hypothetical protein CHISP_0721 [Chitinispirillum alkaliphilum]|nr:hypothetical protein CHISP_0721 [Chitinispirillum alkaliphilum]
MTSSANSILRTLYGKAYAQLEKKRRDTMNRPLTSKEITSLLSMSHSRESLYKSIEELYSEEYLQALKNGVNGADLDKIPKYRCATEKEANLLYCDIHSTDDQKAKSSSSSNGA